jgi:hypothetical protein
MIVHEIVLASTVCAPHHALFATLSGAWLVVLLHDGGERGGPGIVLPSSLYRAIAVHQCAVQSGL